MRIVIESTDQLTQIDGVPVRVWEGVTEAGTSCFVFIHRLAVHQDQDLGPFERELAEQLPPGRQVPLRDVL